MTTRRRLAVVAICVAVALLVAFVTADRSRPGPAAAIGSVFLGPDPGEGVATYLARLPATLPPAGTTALALVTYAPERTPAAAEPSGDATLVEVVFRVDLPGVQTALRFEPLEVGVPVVTALDSARRRAAGAAAADSSRLTARSRDVAAAEATALGAPGCPCVVATVASGDGTALRTLTRIPGVRAVEAAPVGAALRELALSPLLPEQTVRADPLPDNGPVP